MDEQRMIGHRQDASFEELNEALFEATLEGHEGKIANLQKTLRERFGNLL